MPHGVLFRGNAEAEIRKNLIRKGYIKGIISLPANLFYGTGIPACIIVVDKENAESRKGIFMIDASKSFLKDGNKNRLREQDIHKIVDVFNNQKEIEKYSRLVSHAEITDEKNDFNLNIPRYIDSQETEDIQDIEAHLLGGIRKADVDALENYWEVYPSMKSKLFAKSERNGYYKLKIEQKHIRVSVFSHPEFTEYANEINRVCVNWHKRNAPVLKEIKKNDKPKKIIHALSENLLAVFTGKKLLTKYKALSREEIKMLVVDDKWLTHINHEVQNEMDKVSQRLAQRINELVERYTTPLPQLAESVKALEKKVNAHLGKSAFQ